MIKERTEFIRNIFYLIDLLIVTICFFSAYLALMYFKKFYTFNFIPGLNVVQHPVSIDLYLRAYWLALIVWAMILKVRGEYHLRVQTYWRLISSYLIHGLVFFGFFTSERSAWQRRTLCPFNASSVGDGSDFFCFLTLGFFAGSGCMPANKSRRAWAIGVQRYGASIACWRLRVYPSPVGCYNEERRTDTWKIILARSGQPHF